MFVGAKQLSHSWQNIIFLNWACRALRKGIRNEEYYISSVIKVFLRDLPVSFIGAYMPSTDKKSGKEWSKGCLGCEEDV